MNLIASKKKASVFIGITFLLLAVVLLTACDDTYQPLESINAEQLIPCPDEIVFGSHTLSGEARRALYDLFVDQFDLD